MTELLDRAVEAIRQMPEAEQDTIAKAILSLAKIGQERRIDASHLPDVLAGLAELERGEVATDAEVAAAFASFER